MDESRLDDREQQPMKLTAYLIGIFCWMGQEPQQPAFADEQLPNIVVIFIDDLGYADIGPFGETRWPTPNLDRMAAQGRRFTDFVVSSAVCSASRAALLTGCYHLRVGISGALGPDAKQGLNADEMTIAELCRQRGYSTACFGKWHLGHLPSFLPLQHGFDEYYGLPYSNDMWPLHPDYIELPPEVAKRKQGFPDLPLIEGNEIVDAEVTGDDQTHLTTDYTNRAIDFIQRNRERPFFLYVPHSMVHVPLFVSEKFAGKSGHGLFGDVMMEVDWSVGQIIDALERVGVVENTLVVFTSDNGPWLSYGNHAGTALPLREGKGTMFEGGYRVPMIMQWPGKIPSGTTCDELCSTIDLLPTISGMIGGKLPEHKIDGKNIFELLSGKQGAESPHEAFYCYYSGGELQAVRDRRWKWVFPHQFRTMQGQPLGADGSPGPYRQEQATQALYDLKSDVGETTDVASQHPDIVARLQAAAEKARQDLGDKLTKSDGTGIRPAGQAN